MNNNDAFKKANDISEINSEIDIIKHYLNSGDIQELQKHLQELQRKYFVETAIYNMAHTAAPRSLEENALNCIDFLNALLIKKRQEKQKIIETRSDTMP